MSDPMATAGLYGGKHIPVTMRDGTSAVVHLRLVTIEEIGEYLDKAVDERAALKMCVASVWIPGEGGTKDPLEFDVNALSDESYNTLVDENLSLNFTRALAMKEREAVRAEKTGRGITGLMEGVVAILQKFAPSSPSPADSPGSKSSA